MSRTRVTVLTFINRYLPGYKYGGPVRTLANMVGHLGDEFHFHIVTSDRDAQDNQPYLNMTIDGWNEVEKAQVFYCSPSGRSLKALARLMRETQYDVLYLNSFFDPVFTLRPLLLHRLGLVPRRPTIIAPRGEFSRGALSLKRWKKAPYRVAARVLGVYQDLTWLASGVGEASDIRRAMSNIAKNIHIVPNLPPTIVALPPPRKYESQVPLRSLFLCRIAPMKNLGYALQVLTNVSVRVELTVAGPIGDEDYWTRCQTLIAKLPAHITVRYAGSVPPTEVPEVMAAHDLFFLPTRGENFGHVILEALSAGTPVLISDQTPWRDDGAGGCTALPLQEPGAFVASIERFARQSPTERAATRAAALQIARSFSEDNSLVEKTRALFFNAVKGGHPMVGV